MNGATRLRQILDENKYLLIVSAYDVLSARIIEAVGFKAVATSGFSLAASFLGKPDVGLLTFSENLTIVRNVINAVNVPVIADIDTGYGNAINVMRTIDEFEKAGTAAVLLEDQVEPKKCPLGHGVQVVSVEEMVGKIRAANAARKNKDMMIVARTDAEGEEAIRRGRIYMEAGADLIKPGSKKFGTLEGIKYFSGQFPGKSYVTVADWAGEPPDLEALADCGVKILSFPLFLILSTAKCLFDSLRYVREHRWTPVPEDRTMAMPDWFNFIGMEEVREKEKRYLPST